MPANPTQPDKRREKAFQVLTTVFMPHTRDTHVKLKRGERLFVLTDQGITESPHSGPQEVLILAENFGCWPVVALHVPIQYAAEWRKVTKADAARMMKRVRAKLMEQKEPHP